MRNKFYDVLIALNGQFITRSNTIINNLLYIDTIAGKSQLDTAWRWYSSYIKLPEYKDLDGYLSFKSRITGKGCNPGDVIKNYDWVPIESLMTPLIYLIPIESQKLEYVNVSDFDPNYKSTNSKNYWHAFGYIDGEFTTSSNMSLKFANSFGLVRGDTPVDAFNSWYTSKINTKVKFKSKIRNKEVTGKVYNFDWFPYEDLVNSRVTLVKALQPVLNPVPISELIIKAMKENGIDINKRKIEVPKNYKPQDPKKFFESGVQFIDQE